MHSLAIGNPNHFYLRAMKCNMIIIEYMMLCWIWCSFLTEILLSSLLLHSSFACRASYIISSNFPFLFSLLCLSSNHVVLVLIDMNFFAIIKALQNFHVHIGQNRWRGMGLGSLGLGFQLIKWASSDILYYFCFCTR